MSSARLKRVYFDTNILRHWPHLPNDVYALFRAARWLGTEIYVPKVVEAELEAQFVRAVNAVYDSLNAGTKELNKLCRDVIAVDVSGSRPDDDALRDAFRVRSEQLKSHFGITTIPLTTLGLDCFIDMAISRTLPFEEYIIEKNKKAVVGLQDAAILFSIIEHLKTAQKEDRCAFISSDGVFHKAEMRKLLGQHEVPLEVFKTVSDLFDDLYSHIWEATRTAWDAERQQIETSLNEQKDKLALQIFPLLTASEVGRGLSNRTKDITGFAVSGFRFVMTELPEPECRPPHTEAYRRPGGSTVKISARASTQIDAIVETVSWYGMFLPADLPQPDPTPKIEEKTFHEDLNVSLVGTVQNGIIGDFQVTAVEQARP